MRRVNVVLQHITRSASAVPEVSLQATSGADTLSVVDNRTGKSYDIKITDNTIKGGDLKAIKGTDGQGLMTFDPGYGATTCCVSKISFIDGDKGILRYRGIPIEQLAEKSSYMETSFLVLYGELPTAAQLQKFEKEVMQHSFINQDLNKMTECFRYDAHPMGMLCAAFAALGTLHPEANPAIAGQNIYKDPAVRNKQILRIIGNGPTLAAMAYRHKIGRPFIQPNPELSYTENFLYMLDVMHEGPNGFRPHPKIVHAVDVLLILHAEHELNCSTSAMRHLASSNVDVYTSISAATGALYGPRHGGANEAVLRMLEKIGHKDNVADFVQKVKDRKETLMGFGHRVYKNYDPRATIVRKLVDDVFAICGTDELLEVAMALEKIALEDEYFKSRKLYPNVDFYSGLIYKALGIPTDMYTIMFALPRLTGWLAHWQEWVVDPDNKIYRPFQVYKGIDVRDYEEPKNRQAKIDDAALAAPRSAVNRRRDAAKGEARVAYSQILPGTDD